MTFHLLTIFPDFFQAILAHGVLGRAIQSGLVRAAVHNLRDWAPDRHKTVDDRPFGGGEGMLLKAAPVFSAVESIMPVRGAGRKVILLNQAGKNTHEDICSSLELFAREVMPEFQAREAEHQEWKRAVLAGEEKLEIIDTEAYNMAARGRPTQAPSEEALGAKQEIEARIAAAQSAAAGS